MRTSWRFDGIGRTPLAFRVSFALLAVNFVVGDVLTARAWQPAPDARHPYGILFRGGTWRYYGPHVGWWVDHWMWAHFALMAATALVLWRHRADLQLRKVEPPSTPPAPPGVGDWVFLLLFVPAIYSALGAFLMVILFRQAGWPTVFGTGAIFLLISLVTVALTARPLLKRGGVRVPFTAALALAAVVTLLALVGFAALFWDAAL
jgi:hypothetical protein